MDKRMVTVSKKYKTSNAEYESKIKEIRQQFADQLRCLEARTECQCALLTEIHDFYKRRGELELEHGRNLEKLAKSIQSKNKSNEQKRDAWSQHSSHNLWTELVEQTRTEARQRLILADVYLVHVPAAANQRIEHLQRLARRCRDIASVAHEEICRVLSELQTAFKTYQLVYANCSAIESKFRAAESARTKFEELHPEKLAKSRKYRVLEKDFEKKRDKFAEAKLRALKARNEYLLCVEAANAALHQYIAEDMSDLIDCTDLGIQHWLGHITQLVVACRKALCQSEMDAVAELSGLKDNFDSRLDKQKFIEANHSMFSLPKRFEFRPHLDDDIRQVVAQTAVQHELVQRLWQIEKRLNDLRTDHDEIWKTLVVAEKRLLDVQVQPVLPVTELFQTGPVQSGSVESSKSCREPEAHQLKRRQELNELEDFYLEKFHHYLLTSNLIKRLKARSTAIRRALSGKISRNNQGNDQGPQRSPANSSEQTELGHKQYELHSTNAGAHPNSAAYSSSHTSNDNSSVEETPSTAPTPSTPDEAMLAFDLDQVLANPPPVLPPKPRRRRIGHETLPRDKRPKLFGGSLEDYIEATGEQIPLVVLSCIRVLSTYGLHHQGVFRVSGSQLEINSFKEAFEQGEDPLEQLDSSYINPVAGLLKLYFRELREPLFPVFMFNQFTDCSKLTDRQQLIEELQNLLGSLSPSVVVVLRYLFAFLNHLSEFSDENMMDPYNLAICFGPTLLPIPDGKDQVFYHNYVNELIKNLIVHYEIIFPWQLPGPIYEKFVVENDAGQDNDHLSDEIEQMSLPANGEPPSPSPALPDEAKSTEPVHTQYALSLSSPVPATIEPIFETSLDQYQYLDNHIHTTDTNHHQQQQSPPPVYSILGSKSSNTTNNHTKAHRERSPVSLDPTYAVYDTLHNQNRNRHIGGSAADKHTTGNSHSPNILSSIASADYDRAIKSPSAAVLLRPSSLNESPVAAARGTRALSTATAVSSGQYSNQNNAKHPVHNSQSATTGHAQAQVQGEQKRALPPLSLHVSQEQDRHRQRGHSGDREFDAHILSGGERRQQYTHKTLSMPSAMHQLALSHSTTNGNALSPTTDGHKRTMSPSSLVEIQSELKAVLSSLEQFSIQNNVPSDQPQQPPDVVQSTGNSAHSTEHNNNHVTHDSSLLPPMVKPKPKVPSPSLSQANAHFGSGPAALGDKERRGPLNQHAALYTTTEHMHM